MHGYSVGGLRGIGFRVRIRTTWAEILPNVVLFASKRESDISAESGWCTSIPIKSTCREPDSYEQAPLCDVGTDSRF